MSEAPERIWADMDGCWWDKPYGKSPEYVRCDMLQEIFARYSRVEADRIEELEAKLAKAMRALDEAIYFIDIDEEDILRQAGMYRIVKSYAELGALIPAEWADALKRVAELTGGKDE